MSADGEPREAEALPGVLAPELSPGVVGHAAAAAAVEVMLEAGRLPGAILLHGPLGVGKATLAFALARRILAATGDEPAHRVSEQVRAGSHPNLFVLRRRPRDGKGFYSVIRVDEVRAQREAIRMTRGRAGQRIAVIDSVDDCNPSAANALLKTLEEPPPETTFFLISHRPGQLLPTIRSRCHAIALRPLPDHEVGAVLGRGSPGLPQATLKAAVALAAGRPRRALEALALGGKSPVAALRAWLREPGRAAPAIHLAIAGDLAGDDGGLAFGRETLLDWMVEEARAASLAGARMRLASVNELWEKAHATLAEADSLNLDPRQTLVVLLDAVHRHGQQFPSAEPR